MEKLARVRGRNLLAGTSLVVSGVMTIISFGSMEEQLMIPQFDATTVLRARIDYPPPSPQHRLNTPSFEDELCPVDQPHLYILFGQ